MSRGLARAWAWSRAMATSIDPPSARGDLSSMKHALKARPVAKLPDKVRLQGRILFLAEDAALVRQQLEGRDLDWRPEHKLRDDISTDEITPAYICYYFDETLGEFPYLGLKCGTEFPITRGSVKRGGYVAAVSGKRRGKGSSREQSPYAEMMAGIKLVIAENIERIYRENCQNLGVLTTTDFSIIEKVRRGDELPLSAFTAGEGEITRGIIEYGGLFNYNVARLQGKVAPAAPTTPRRPMTLGEKILARQWGVDLAHGTVGVPAGQPGDEGVGGTDIRFSHAYVAPMAANVFGQVIIGSDSHTPHAGAVGCVAFGVGTTAIFNSWITKDVRVKVPETVKVVVRGTKPDNVTAKDFMLEILRHPYIKSGQAIGKLVEYCGEAVESLSVDERATMTNMTAEVGGFTGYVAPDGKTVEYLVAYRGMPRGEAERLCAGLASDAGAEYCEVIEIDAAAIRPMMALPGDPGNGQYIDAAARIRVDIAYAGSCTAGQKEDKDMYAPVLAEAAEARATRPPL